MVTESQIDQLTKRVTELTDKLRDVLAVMDEDNRISESFAGNDNSRWLTSDYRKSIADVLDRSNAESTILIELEELLSIRQAWTIISAEYDLHASFPKSADVLGRIREQRKWLAEKKANGGAC